MFDHFLECRCKSGSCDYTNVSFDKQRACALTSAVPALILLSAVGNEGTWENEIHKVYADPCYILSQ